MPALQRCAAPSQTSDTVVRLRVEVFDALMAAKGVTSVAEQARVVGVHRATIFRLRAGSGTSARTAMKLAAACRTTVDKLFERVA